MKNISINLYSIDELSKEAQERAFEKYQNFNVENDYWYDSEFDDFVAVCRTIGIKIPTNGISFSGFWSQGDGSSFCSTIDILPLICGIEQKTWKEYSLVDFKFKNFPCQNRILKLIRNGLISCDHHTKRPVKGNWISFQSDYSFGRSWEKEYPNIENELEKLDKWLEDCLTILNDYLYKSLQDTYEYLTGNEALKETFIANEYHFTEDGMMANELINLAL